MSNRTRQLGEIAKQSEQQAQSAHDYEMYKAQFIRSCVFQLTSDLREATRIAVNEFNSTVGHGSKAAINHFAEIALGIKLVKEHYPSVYLTATVDADAQCLIVECTKTDRTGSSKQPTSRYSLEVEDRWVRIRDGGRLITESELVASIVLCKRSTVV